MRKLISCFILSFICFTCFAADTLSLAPAMGMMKTHYVVPYGDEGEKFYDYLRKYDNLGDDNQGRVDSIVLAILSINNVDTNSDLECVEITISYDGLFRSDINPSIVRPYEIYLIERTNRGHSEGSKSHYKKDSPIFTGTTNIEFPSKSILDLYKSDSGTSFFWADFVLQLPQDGADSNGITYDETYYPLIEGSYSSEVTITARLKKGGEVIEADSITVPIVAEHTENKIAIGERNSKVSMNVVTNANALNMNLDEMLRTGNPVQVGTLNFMIRSSDNSMNADETPTGDKCTDLNAKLKQESYSDWYWPYDTTTAYHFVEGTAENYKLFLSASENPFETNPNGFMFVHQDFVPGISSYNDLNSVPFYVQVTGINDSYDQLGVYTGKEYADSGTGDINGDTLYTKCKKIHVLDEGIYKFNKYTTGWGGNINGIDRTYVHAYSHYHTFEGEISVFVQQNTDLMLNAGQYHGDIYVHVISY